MLGSIERKATRVARGVALSLTGAICVAVGLGFLTVGGWIYLTAIEGTLFAAVVIGAIYVGLGLVLIGVTSARRAPSPAAQPNPQVPALTEAFLVGLEAGRSAKQTR